MVELVRRKPFGLAMLMAVLGFIGGLGTIVSVVLLAGALLADGPFTVNGETASKGDFLRSTLPFFAVYIPGAVLAACSAWSIYAEHERSRPLLMIYFAVPVLLGPGYVALGVPASEVAPAMVGTLFFPVVAWLYLYRRHPVVEYYKVIASDRAAGRG